MLSKANPTLTEKSKLWDFLVWLTYKYIGHNNDHIIFNEENYHRNTHSE